MRVNSMLLPVMILTVPSYNVFPLHSKQSNSSATNNKNNPYPITFALLTKQTVM